MTESHFGFRFLTGFPGYGRACFVPDMSPLFAWFIDFRGYHKVAAPPLLLCNLIVRSVHSVCFGGVAREYCGFPSYNGNATK